MLLHPTQTVRESLDDDVASFRVSSHRLLDEPDGKVQRVYGILKLACRKYVITRTTILGGSHLSIHVH